MTLIVAAGCPDYAVLVADRRLTFNGRVREDESNKLIFLRSHGLRLAVAYTGVAQLGSFTTAEWLPSRLQDAIRPDGVLRLDRFCEHATEDFARLRSARPEDRLLSLGVVGFVAAAETNERQLIQVLMGNGVVHEDGKAARLAPFTWRGGTYSADSRETFALVGGAIDPTLQPSLGRITRLLEGGRPARAVVHRAVELIRAAAERDSRVGAQCSSGIVHRSGEVVYDYHTSYPVKRIYSPTIVTSQKVFLGVMVERLSEGVAAVPRVATSAPCPCKSGKRYGRCHGRPPARGVKPKFEFTDAGDIRFVVGQHVLAQDTEAMTLDLSQELLPSTRRLRRAERRRDAQRTRGA